jgi:ribosomal protein S19
MTHRHEIGELLSEFYVTRHNSDLTEGRGGDVDAGIFEDRWEAHKATKGIDVQGTDGSIVRRTYNRCTGCPEIIKTDLPIYYGSKYVKNRAGERHGFYKDFMPDGWRKDYSPMVNDPEYKEYLRLKDKYESNGQ